MRTILYLYYSILSELTQTRPSKNVVKSDHLNQFDRGIAFVPRHRSCSLPGQSQQIIPILHEECSILYAVLMIIYIFLLLRACYQRITSLFLSYVCSVLYVHKRIWEEFCNSNVYRASRISIQKLDFDLIFILFKA